MHRSESGLAMFSGHGLVLVLTPRSHSNTEAEQSSALVVDTELRLVSISFPHLRIERRVSEDPNKAERSREKVNTCLSVTDATQQNSIHTHRVVVQASASAVSHT